MQILELPSAEESITIKILELPSAEESITIKILELPIEHDFIVTYLGAPVGQDHKSLMKCCIQGKEDECYYLELRPFILKGLLRECRNNNVHMDEYLSWSIGKLFTIFGKHWVDASKLMWRKNEITGELEPPTVHSIEITK